MPVAGAEECIFCIRKFIFGRHAGLYGVTLLCSNRAIRSCLRNRHRPIDKLFISFLTQPEGGVLEYPVLPSWRLLISTWVAVITSGPAGGSAHRLVIRFFQLWITDNKCVIIAPASRLITLERIDWEENQPFVHRRCQHRKNEKGQRVRGSEGDQSSSTAVIADR